MLELSLFISEVRRVRRVIKGLRIVMRGDISVLNSEMNAVNLFVSNWLGKGSLGLFNVNIFDLIPLTVCENNMFWVSLGSFWEVENTLLWCVILWKVWLLEWVWGESDYSVITFELVFFLKTLEILMDSTSLIVCRVIISIKCTFRW